MYNYKKEDLVNDHVKLNAFKKTAHKIKEKDLIFSLLNFI